MPITLLIWATSRIVESSADSVRRFREGNVPKILSRWMRERIALEESLCATSIIILYTMKRFFFKKKKSAI